MEALLQNMQGVWYKSLQIPFLVSAEGLFRCCRFGRYFPSAGIANMGKFQEGIERVDGLPDE